MRYAKGSFVITAERDIPLLRQVRNSRFIGHQQLFELLQYDAVASCRSTTISNRPPERDDRFAVRWVVRRRYRSVVARHD